LLPTAPFYQNQLLEAVPSERLVRDLLDHDERASKPPPKQIMPASPGVIAAPAFVRATMAPYEAGKLRANHFKRRLGAQYEAGNDSQLNGAWYKVT